MVEWVYLVEITPRDSDLLLRASVFTSREDARAESQAAWACGAAADTTQMTVTQFASECLTTWARSMARGRKS